MKTNVVQWVLVLFVAALFAGCGDDEELVFKGLNIVPEELALVVGESHTLTLEAQYSWGTASPIPAERWTSSSPNVATVDATGLVRALAPGEVLIHAYKSGEEAVAALSVVPAGLERVVIEAPAEYLDDAGLLQVRVDHDIPLNAYLVDAEGARVDGRAVEWSVAPRGTVLAQLAPFGEVKASNDLRMGMFGDFSVRATIDGVSAVLGGSATLKLASLTAGEASFCGISTGKRVWCWGLDIEDMIPTLSFITGNSKTAHIHPLPVATHHEFESLALGSRHACGVDSLGTAWCWGEGGTWILDGATDHPTTLEPVKVGVSEGRLTGAIDAGGNTTCALTKDATLLCWGAYTPNGPWEFSVDGGAVRSFDVGINGQLICAIVERNGIHEVYCMGDNKYNQVDGTDNPTTWPLTYRAALVDPAEHVGVGEHHACVGGRGLRGGVDDTLCWGYSENGQAGVVSDSATPHMVVSMRGRKVSQLALGEMTSCALVDVDVYCWGELDYYVLSGAEGALEHEDPMTDAFRVESPVKFQSIYANLFTLCGISADQAQNVYCWGLDVGGIIGFGEWDLPSLYRVVRTPQLVMGQSL